MGKLEQAFKRLEEAPKGLKVSDIERDGVIQRFEIAFELTWKTFKDFLINQGIEVNSPKTAIKGAFQQKWITNEELWLQMMNDRNSTPHIYDEEKAKEIFTRMESFIHEISQVIEILKKQAGD